MKYCRHKWIGGNTFYPKLVFKPGYVNYAVYIFAEWCCKCRIIRGKSIDQNLKQVFI